MNLFFLRIIHYRFFFHSTKEWDSPTYCKTTEVLSQRTPLLSLKKKNKTKPTGPILILISMDIMRLYMNIPNRREIQTACRTYKTVYVNKPGMDPGS